MTTNFPRFTPPHPLLAACLQVLHFDSVDARLEVITSLLPTPRAASNRSPHPSATELFFSKTLGSFLRGSVGGGGGGTERTSPIQGGGIAIPGGSGGSVVTNLPPAPQQQHSTPHKFLRGIPSRKISASGGPEPPPPPPPLPASVGGGGSSPYLLSPAGSMPAPPVPGRPAVLEGPVRCIHVSGPHAYISSGKSDGACITLWSTSTHQVRRGG